MKKMPDPVLRIAGLLLILLAAWIARSLFRTADHDAPYEPIDYMLALVLLLTGSCGLALAGWGRSLFDQVTLSSRWTIYERGRRGGK